MRQTNEDPAGEGGAGSAARRATQSKLSTTAPAEWRALVARELRRLPSTTAGRDGELKIRCLQPGHEDRKPSATWSESKGCGTCHSCGATYSTKDAADLLGIHLPRNGDGPDRPPGVWPHVTEGGHRYDLSQWWSYRDGDGAEIGIVARYDCTGQSKTFRPFFQRKGGEWAAGYKDKNRRPLYGLDKLAGRPDAPAIVAEGEKAADAASGLLPAYVAVTWPGGAAAVRRAAWDQLAGREVVVWPDHDDAGRKALPDLLDGWLREGDDLLFEGAQGALLDIDHGTFPFVTSSNSTAGGAATGTGLSPTVVDGVVGILKAYTTRVGSGPFTSELTDAVGEHLRTRGNEFGTVTGRPRRCGWLDLVAARYARRLNGVDGISTTPTSPRRPATTSP